MTRLLETPFSGTQNSLPSKTKFVDQSPSGKSFLAERLAAAPRLGNGFYRKDYLGNFDADGSVGGIGYTSPYDVGGLSPEDRLRFDMAALDEEERNTVHILSYAAPTSAELPWNKRTHTDVIKFLPLEWQPFLERMPSARRKEREQAILRKIGWDGLDILCLRADALAERAK